MISTMIIEHFCLYEMQSYSGEFVCISRGLRKCIHEMHKQLRAVDLVQ